MVHPRLFSEEDPPAYDVVCGMQITPESRLYVTDEGNAESARLLSIEYAEHHTEHKGNQYYFCSLPCKLLFENNPRRYSKHARLISQVKTSWPRGILES